MTRVNGLGDEVEFSIVARVTRVVKPLNHEVNVDYCVITDVHRIWNLIILILFLVKRTLAMPWHLEQLGIGSMRRMIAVA